MVTIAERPHPRPIVVSRASDTWLTAGAALVAAAVVVAVADTDLSLGSAIRAIAFAAVPIATAMFLIVRGGPVARGAGAMVAGIVGISISPALVAELAIGGRTGVGVAGLVGALASVGLLGAGGVILFRALHPLGRAAAAGLLVLAAQFVLLPVAMATFGTHYVTGPVSMTPPAGAERVSLATADGVQLAAWYTPSRNGAAVVLLHGAGGTKADTVGHAAVLAERGYAVLAVDARGGGESGGRGMLWGWHGDLDIAAAVTFLSDQPDVDPARIGAVGLSMGGEQAITAAASDARIQAVVAEGASARVPADAAGLEGGIQGAIQRLYYPIMWGVADLMSESSPPIPLAEAVTRFGDRHLLLISSDDPNDHAAGPRIRDAAPATVELWEPRTAHTQALATHPDEWTARVLGFLDRELGSQ